jgi:hypothetical protein
MPTNYKDAPHARAQSSGLAYPHAHALLLAQIARRYVSAMYNVIVISTLTQSSFLPVCLTRSDKQRQNTSWLLIVVLLCIVCGTQ